MTTNGHDWKFKNRVKKMLAEKIVGDSSSCGKNRKKAVHNSGKNSTGVFKATEQLEIIIPDDESSNVLTNNENGIKARKQGKSRKKKGRVDSKKNEKQIGDDNAETLSKEKVRKKRRRLEETDKNLQPDCSSKKRKTNSKVKRMKMKKSVAKNSSVLIEELNPDNDHDDDLLSDDNNEPDEPMLVFEKKMIFGVPTIIKGAPKNDTKFPFHNSPVSSLNATSIPSNSRGNILSNFFSDAEDPHSTIFQNAQMTSDTIHDYDSEKTDDIDENGSELYSEIVEIPDDNSDNSFISDDEKSGSNSGANQTSNDFGWESSIGDSALSENDSKEKPEFYSLQNKVIATMSPCCKFYFNGKLRVKVLVGKVEIYGFVFGRSETAVPAEIYSPRGSSLVSIETLDRESGDETSDESLYRLLINEGINKGVATDMQNRLNPLADGQAVLVFENLENTLTKYLDFYCPFKLFPKTEDSTNYHNRHPKKAEKLLQATFQYNDFGKQLKKDPYRETRVLNQLFDSENPNDSKRILIAGGKGVGKSTTLRYFVNSLLPARKEIVVVDFDPGQPEFTPPGCISLNIVDRPLTGPNYTHQKTPFYQIFIGDVNVAKCVPRYVKAARKLVDRLNESPRLRGRTVLVNTMGFCEGIGWDLMVYMIKLIHPSTVVQISSERSKNNFRHLLSSEVINNQIPTRFTAEEGEEKSVWEVECDHDLHVVPSLAEGKGKFGDFWEMEPRQQRDIALLSYLSKIAEEDEDDGKFLFSPLPRINDIVPYSVPMSTLTISLIRTIIPASHILATMNGNIVALCGIDGTDETSEEPCVAGEFYPKTLLRAPVSTCYGFGIVRGVDMKKGSVYINTPLSSQELKYVNAFIGSIPLPIALISSDHRNAPYVGEGADLPTSREPRRGYFRMRQRNNS